MTLEDFERERKKFGFFRKFVRGSVNLLCDASFVSCFFWNPYTGRGAVKTLLDGLENVFERRVKLYTTRCVTADVYQSDLFPRAFFAALCEHDGVLPPLTCVANVIGHSNFGNFTIATMDREVVTQMAERKRTCSVLVKKKDFEIVPASSYQIASEKGTKKKKRVVAAAKKRERALYFGRVRLAAEKRLGK